MEKNELQTLIQKVFSPAQTASLIYVLNKQEKTEEIKEIYSYIKPQDEFYIDLALRELETKNKNFS